MAAEGRCTIDEFMHSQLDMRIRNQTCCSFVRLFQRREKILDNVCCLCGDESGEQHCSLFGQRRICGRTLIQESTSASRLNNFPCHASGVFDLFFVYIPRCIDLLLLLHSAS